MPIVKDRFIKNDLTHLQLYTKINIEIHLGIQLSSLSFILFVLEWVIMNERVSNNDLV